MRFCNKIWTRIKCESCRKLLINTNVANDINNNLNVFIDGVTNLSYQNAMRLILQKRRINFISNESLIK